MVKDTVSRYSEEYDTRADFYSAKIAEFSAVVTRPKAYLLVLGEETEHTQLLRGSKFILQVESPRKQVSRWIYRDAILGNNPLVDDGHGGLVLPITVWPPDEKPVDIFLPTDSVRQRMTEKRLYGPFLLENLSQDARIVIDDDYAAVIVDGYYEVTDDDGLVSRHPNVRAYVPHHAWDDILFAGAYLEWFIDNESMPVKVGEEPILESLSRESIMVGEVDKKGRPILGRVSPDGPPESEEAIDLLFTTQVGAYGKLPRRSLILTESGAANPSDNVLVPFTTPLGYQPFEIEGWSDKQGGVIRVPVM